MIASSLSLLLGLAQADTLDFYVAPIRIHNRTEKQDIEQVIDEEMAFTLSSAYSTSFKVLNNRGTYSPVLMEYEDVTCYTVISPAPVFVAHNLSIIDYPGDYTEFFRRRGQERLSQRYRPVITSRKLATAAKGISVPSIQGPTQVPS